MRPNFIFFLGILTCSNAFSQGRASQKLAVAIWQKQRRVVSTEKSNTALFMTNNEIKALQKIDLTDEKIGEMVEKTFIEACLQLATGYVDVLKLFIASVTAAYSRRLSIPYLLSLVENCLINTANRPLTIEEINLRSSWIMITYLTLNTLDKMENETSNTTSNNLDIPPDFIQRHSSVVEEQVSMYLGKAIQSSTTDTGDEVMTKALMAYNLKIINLTLSNVKEARLVDEKIIDEDAVGPPRPNIPGAY